MTNTDGATQGRGTERRSNIILPPTRWLSAIIVPFLVVAFVVLFVFPDHTKDLFAWTIQPRMTPMLLGAIYIGGAYFFVRAATLSHWHRVKVGFLPVTTFATVMGLATIVNWDRFNHTHVAFIIWTALYFTTPFLVLAVWMNNRRTDRAEPEADDLVVPQAVRALLGIGGAVTVVAAIVLFVRPSLLVTIWPWHLTPLTARVMCAIFALTGVGELSIALDSRWSAARIALESEVVTLALVLVAMIFSWGNFDQTNPLSWLFAAGGALLLVATVVLYAWMERTRGQRRTVGVLRRSRT